MRASRVLPLAVLAACVRQAPSNPPTKTPANSSDSPSKESRPNAELVRPDETRKVRALVAPGPSLFPESVDESQALGAEPDGSLRVLTAGLRLVAKRDGALASADERFSQTPQLTVALPARLGGGFLFVVGALIWRAEHWLDTTRPIVSFPQGVQAVFPGLDRVYVRSQNAYSAIDGRTGEALDLGPWPASPFVASFAAVDGWRAAALTDLRGVVVTEDAGATWRSLDLAIEPKQLVVSGRSIAIGGLEHGRTPAWFELHDGTSVTRLATPPREAKGTLLPTSPTAPRTYLPGGFPWGFTPGGLTPSIAVASPDATGANAPTDREHENIERRSARRVFGTRPFVAALEDGWPWTDGTALVARDGAVAQVRLSDGALLTTDEHAFPMAPARCHPVSLARLRDASAFGFVCGDPRGPTVIYAYDSNVRPLREVKRFDTPRVVTSGANGTLAVRGSCGDERPRAPYEASSTSVPSREPHPFCVFGIDDVWREVNVRGDAGGQRVVGLVDGRIAIVSPPEGLASTARLTVLANGRAVTRSLVWPALTSDLARMIRLGVWLDGFEERRAGVIGGWIEAGGVMLGLEIALDGKVMLGRFIRDAGLPFVAGRYGLGWTPSGRGFETTDGGMTWASVELPEPLVPLAKVERRACGPIGCLAAGWLRVGWGNAKKSPIAAVSAHALVPSALPLPVLSLTCNATTQAMPTEKMTTSGALGVASMPSLPPLPSFFGRPGPALRDSERGLPFDVQDLLERYPRIGTLGRVYAWGPKGGDWDAQGRWQIKWLSPFADWKEARASQASIPPAWMHDLTTPTSAYGSGSSSFAGWFQLAGGDDSRHALLIARRMSRTEVAAIVLEAERAPVEIRRADGEPFAEIDAVTRTAGRWYLATPPSAGEAKAFTTIWQVEGAVARELVRVPRAAADTGRPAGVRLARRSDGGAIALVVDGQATAERNAATRWALPVDLTSGAFGEPQSLGYADLAGRTLERCGDGDGAIGWVVDASMPGATVRIRLPHGAGTLHGAYARMRLSASRTCIERIAGVYDGTSPAQTSSTAPPPVTNLSDVVVSALWSQGRYGLRCTLGK